MYQRLYSLEIKRVLNLISYTFDQRGITFSRTMSAKIVGGEARLMRLVMEGKIRVDKPSDKQNGKWFCTGGDVIRNMKL